MTSDPAAPTRPLLGRRAPLALAAVALAGAAALERFPLKVTVLVAIGLCALYVVAARPGLPAGDLALPFAVPFAMVAVGLALGEIRAGDADLTLLAAWVAGAGVVVVACDVARRPGGPRIVLWSGAAALAAVAGAALIAWATGLADLEPLTIDSRGRLTWPFVHPNHLGAFCAVLVPVTLAAALRATRAAHRWGAVAALAVGLAALGASLSRTAWIAAVVGVVVVALYGGGRRIVLVGVPIALVAATPLLVARFAADDSGTDNVRVDIWGDALGMIRDHPITGVGLGRFEESAAPLTSLPGAPLPHHGHSVLLDVGAEAGLIALAGMLLLLARAAWFAHRAARDGAPDDRLAGMGVAGGLAALLVVASLDQPFDDPRTAAVAWAVLGAAAGLARRPRVGAW